MEREQIMARLLEHLNELGIPDESWVGIFLQGSQNYGLDYEGSDIDSKLILLPSLSDLIMERKPVSTTHIMDNNEHCDIKDIREMFRCFRKQNINFVEILFTKYKILNPIYEDLFVSLLAAREDIARYDRRAAIHCMYGMAKEKHHAMEKPYPSKLEVIQKFGYDPKQLHHILRLQDFICRYIEGEAYEECLKPVNQKELIDIKRGCCTLEEARKLADLSVKDIGMMANAFQEVKPDHDIKCMMDKVMQQIMLRRFRMELQEEA